MGQGKTGSEITSRQGLEELVESIIGEHNLDIEVDVEIADRFKRKAGQYRHSEKKIRISKHLLKNYPEKVLGTLKHEIGHAVVMERYGSGELEPHGSEWRSIMRELGVDDPKACHSLQLTDYRYIVRCTNSKCDVETGRYKRSQLVKNPRNYRCSKCGSMFESFEVNQ